MRKNYDKDLVAELYLQGMEYTEIAQRVGISRAAVYNVVKNRKLPRRRPTFVSVSEIRGLQEQELTASEIKEQTGAGISRIDIILGEPVEVEDLSILTYAPKVRPTYEIVTHNGKTYLDVTRDFIQ